MLKCVVGTFRAWHRSLTTSVNRGKANIATAQADFRKWTPVCDIGRTPSRACQVPAQPSSSPEPCCDRDSLREENVPTDPHRLVNDNNMEAVIRVQMGHQINIGGAGR